MGNVTELSFAMESHMAKVHGGPIAGVDEAGRGPLAGPVVAAAVILPDTVSLPGLGDSKKLAPKTRERLFQTIAKTAVVGLAVVWEDEIEKRNILGAALLTMAQALERLRQPPAAALIDGPHCPKSPLPMQAVIGGDGRCFSIAAASIMAKVTRDRIMTKLARRFPGYGWEDNKGYGTPAHRSAMETLGLTPHHRRGFAPVRCLIAAGM